MIREKTRKGAHRSSWPADLTTQYRSGMVHFHQPVLFGPLIENRLLERGANDNLISCGKCQNFLFLVYPSIRTGHSNAEISISPCLHSA